MSKYDFVIKYRKGSENGRADALSRRADHKEGMVPYEEAILQDSQHGLVLGRKTIAANFKVYDGQQEEIIKKAYSKDSTATRILGDLDNHRSFALK